MENTERDKGVEQQARDAWVKLHDSNDQLSPMKSTCWEYWLKAWELCTQQQCQIGWSDADVHKLIIRFIEAKGQYHTAEDMNLVTELIEQYKATHTPLYQNKRYTEEDMMKAWQAALGSSFDYNFKEWIERYNKETTVIGFV